MRIDAKADYHGFTMRQARDVVRRFPGTGHAWYGWGAACAIVGDEARAHALVKTLERDGYLSEHESGRGTYERTLKGNQLAMASARPIKRATAARMLTRLIARAEGINADDDYCYRVGGLVVFGSYLDTTQETLGDLDVGYVMVRRCERGGAENDAFKKACERSLARARKEGRRFASYEDTLWWPEREFKLALKGKTPGLSLHDFQGVDGPVILAGRHEVVFGHLPLPEE